MLHVKTVVKPSKIRGLGLFANERIPKGAVIWSFSSVVDQRFTQEQIRSMSKEEQLYMIKYSYCSQKSGLHIKTNDDGRYINHSETPNSESLYDDNSEEATVYALKDIKPGEEIIENYDNFGAADDGGIYDELAKKYGIDEDWSTGKVVQPSTEDKIKLTSSIAGSVIATIAVIELSHNPAVLLSAIPAIAGGAVTVAGITNSFSKLANALYRRDLYVNGGADFATSNKHSPLGAFKQAVKKVLRPKKYKKDAANIPKP